MRKEIINRPKIGILTFQFANNYGALLQLFALNKYLQNKGFEIEIINKLPAKEKIRFNLKRMVADSISLYLSNSFSQFRKKFLPNIGTVHYSESDLTHAVANKDLVIVGSDQVWRLDYTLNDWACYFLNFVPNSVSRISYAASFGVDNLTLSNDVNQEMLKLLQRFSAISVREESGKNICDTLFGLNVHQVLDPTMLLDMAYYSKIITKKDDVKKEKFISVYLLDYSEEKKRIIEQFAHKNNLKIKNNNRESGVDFSLRSFNFNFKKYTYPSFSKWLSNIKHAEFIFTDSFHGVVFSILFNKQFVCFGNAARGNSRFESLLGQFNLMDRFKNVDSLVGLESVCETTISYKEINEILENKRKESAMFLEQGIIRALDSTRK